MSSRLGDSVDAGASPTDPLEVHGDSVTGTHTFDRNDRGDTLRILQALHDPQNDHLHLIHVYGIGFLSYRAGSWTEVTDHQVAALVSDLLHAFGREALEEAARLRLRLADPSTTREVASAAREQLADADQRVEYYLRRQRQTVHETLVRSLKGQRVLQRAVSDLDRQRHLLVVENGTIDLRTGDLVRNDPAHLITTRIRIPYHPQRDEDGELIFECPRWEQFMSECHHDPEVVAYLQRVAGYSATGETNEHCFVLHAGRGSNGKGTYLNMLTRIFEGITTVRPADMLDPRRGGGQEMAELRGARLVVVNEGEIGQAVSEARLKTLTGGDYITGRRLYQQSIQFKPSFTLHFSTNHKPQFRDATEGLWRRLHLVHWKQIFTGERMDRTLELQLLSEQEGILAWAVAGAVQYYRQGLAAPEAVLSAVEEYREVVDPLSGFLTGEVYTFEPGERVPFKEVHAAYVDWLPEGKPWSLQALRQALEERGAEFVRGGGRWHLKNYRKVSRHEAKSGLSLIDRAGETTA